MLAQRRSSDGYISVTGLFKAAFPWATRAEEERERAMFAADPATDDEEIAGNLWSDPRYGKSTLFLCECASISRC